MDQQTSLEKEVNEFLKRFVELGIDLQTKYRGNLFFRTIVRLCILVFCFAVISVVTFTLAWWMQDSAWYFFMGSFFVALVLGVLLASAMLRPVGDALYYQQLFIGNIAHELRTPLSTIKMSTEVALLDDTLSAATKKTYADVLHEVDTISNILSNLMFLNTAMQTDNLKLEKIDLGPIVESVVKKLSPLAQQRGVQVLVNTDSDSVVLGNAVALEQIVLNLVKNAICYNLPGVSGSVTLSIKPYHYDSICFLVTDTGVGISPIDITHIFEPFYRIKKGVPVRGTKTPGSGLGLTIVKAFVEALHGKIKVQSVIGQGTTVSVFLPRAESYVASYVSSQTNDTEQETTKNTSDTTGTNHYIFMMFRYHSLISSFIGQR